VLRHQTPAVRTFLVRTSILRRMTGSLCDAVLDGSGSQAVLEQIERANLFVVPLDAERRGYRYHRAFADVLRAELSRSRPELIAELHRRASAWFDAAGAHQEAAEHALAALRLADPARRPDDRRGDQVVEDQTFSPAHVVPGNEPDLDFGQRLTDRERTILRLLRTRLSQREIADELFVSVNTVKTHSRAIYRKLGVSSRQAATDRARELELLDTQRTEPAARTRPEGEDTGGALAS
jgi:ATP/maltotriose-dependent transcriptional regulator MalT